MRPRQHPPTQTIKNTTHCTPINPIHSKPNNNKQKYNMTATSLLSQNQLLIKQLLLSSLHSTTSPNSNKDINAAAKFNQHARHNSKNQTVTISPTESNNMLTINKKHTTPRTYQTALPDSNSMSSLKHSSS
jgi:hypothetical protein